MYSKYQVFNNSIQFHVKPGKRLTNTIFIVRQLHEKHIEKKKGSLFEAR